jgi:hypothetical protein
LKALPGVAKSRCFPCRRLDFEKIRQISPRYSYRIAQPLPSKPIGRKSSNSALEIEDIKQSISVEAEVY